MTPTPPPPILLELLPSSLLPATNATTTTAMDTATIATATTAATTTTAAEPGCRLSPAVTRRDWGSSWRLGWRRLPATGPTRKGESRIEGGCRSSSRWSRRFISLTDTIRSARAVVFCSYEGITSHRTPPHTTATWFSSWRTRKLNDPWHGLRTRFLYFLLYDPPPPSSSPFPSPLPSPSHTPPHPSISPLHPVLAHAWLVFRSCSAPLCPPLPTPNAMLH